MIGRGAAIQTRRAAVAVAAAAALGGCRSAAPETAPSVPSAPVEAAEPETAPGSAVLSFDPKLPELPPLSADDLAPGDEPLDSGPQELQREALDLCQSAEALLDHGETEEAVAALDRAYELMLALPADGDDSYLQAKDDIRLLVADLIQRIYRAGRGVAAAPVASWDLGMPLVDNEQVQREIKSLTTAELEQFLAGYRRAGRYRPMILERLAEAGLPSQLSWLPLVESWFKPRAYSRAAAVGMWQFISSTGLRYGLNRDAWIDERYDPEKATGAAIAYLIELHGLFGDWPKALAAYNCGEARVQRLQRRHADDFMDFWDLYELLPRETRRYVPRLIAAIQIIENPEVYGVELPEPDPPLELERVEVSRPVQLEKLDEALGLEKGTLADLNPELRHKATPERAYSLKVPAGRGEAVVAKLDSLPAWSRPEYVTHRVRSGETLSVIARRYRTSVSAIMSWNNLRSAHRIRIGQRLRIPVSGRRAVSRGPSFDPVDGTHTVRRGESLHIIARRYGTTVARLKRDNGLASNTIHPGQRLEVRRPAAASGEGGRRYQVARGDTLGAIADAHGVSLSALLSLNGLSRRSTIYPGQWLVIP